MLYEQKSPPTPSPKNRLYTLTLGRGKKGKKHANKGKKRSLDDSSISRPGSTYHYYIIESFTVFGEKLRRDEGAEEARGLVVVVGYWGWVGGEK